jgi:hypothetical protein
MILTKSIIIEIQPRNMGYYKKIGHDDIGVGDEIEIEIENINKGSHSIINCKCDNCGKEKKIEYRVYLGYNPKNFGDYLCRKCSQFKLEDTNLKKYGKKYPSQRIEILDKMKSSMIEKYSVENASQSNEIQNKKIKTNNIKFGCDWGLSNDLIKKKSRTTLLEKYGVEHCSQIESIKNKKKKTCLGNWGVDNFAKTKEYKEKSKKTCLEKYGVEYPSQCEISKENRKQTFFKKYGVEHVLLNEDIYKKMIRSSFKINYYKNTPLYYQGTYEKDFLDKYFGKFTIMNGKTISYKINDKNLKYYSDFFLPEYNLIVEIKSTMWFNKHLEKNIMKEQSCKDQGYQFVFIIDKDYTKFNDLIK